MKKIVKDIFIIVISLLITINFSLLKIGTTLADYDKWACDFDGGKIYFSIQHEGNPLAVRDISQFQAVVKALSEIENSVYYEIYHQPLYQRDNSTGVLDINTLSAVQISKNVQTDFKINLWAGRKFVDSDFLISDRIIPIVIGYDLKDNFSIGDHFCAEYLFDDYEFVVVGILAQNSNIEISNGSYLLGDYIVMPNFEILDDRMSTKGIKIHYADKSSGKIGTKIENGNYVLKEIERITKHTEVGTYSFYTTMADANLRIMTGLGIKEIAILDVIGILLLTAVLLFLYQTMKEYRKRKIVWLNIAAGILAVLIMKFMTQMLDVPYQILFILVVSSFPILLYEVWRFVQKKRKRRL